MCIFFLEEYFIYIINVNQVIFSCESNLLLLEIILLFKSGNLDVTTQVTSPFIDNVLHQTDGLIRLFFLVSHVYFIWRASIFNRLVHDLIIRHLHLLSCSQTIYYCQLLET